MNTIFTNIMNPKIVRNLSIVTIFLMGIFATAQDKIYIHTATEGDFFTTLNIPELINNPEAKFVVSHTWNPGGGNTGVLNNHPFDVYLFNGIEWRISNIDDSDIPIGTKFNVFIPDNPDDDFVHIATAENAASPIHTLIDNPDFNNNNRGPFAVWTRFYNPNSVESDSPYGFYYDVTANKRGLYAEDAIAIQQGAAFFILNGGTTEDANHFSHTAVAANIINNTTLIDSPALNGNPNATFVFSHYWGSAGSSSEVNVVSQMGTFYNDNEQKWGIFRTDELPMPVGATFDIIVADNALSTEDVNSEIVVNVFPNPAKSIVNIDLPTNVELNYDQLFDIIGKDTGIIIQNHKLDISTLPSGVYILKLSTKSGIITKKIIKE